MKQSFAKRKTTLIVDRCLAYLHTTTIQTGAIMRALGYLLLVIASLAYAAPFVASEESFSEDALEAASLKEAFQANLESIDVGDVVIETTKLRYEEGMRSMEESTVRERMVLDEKQGIGLYAKVFEVRRVQPEGENEPLVTKVIVAQQVGDRAGYRVFPEPVGWSVVNNAQTFAWTSNYPDMRFIGHLAYPAPAGSMPEALAKSILKSVARPNATFQHSGNRNALVTHRYSLDSTQIRITNKTYDLRNNLLISTRVSRHLQESKEEIPQLVERYQWSQAGDVYVPSRIQGEQRKQAKGADGKPEVWIENYDASFRWLAVNSKVDATKSEVDLVTDLNVVLKFVAAEGEEDMTTSLP